MRMEVHIDSVKAKSRAVIMRVKHIMKTQKEQSWKKISQ